MTASQTKSAIVSLSQSQGFYGRLFRQIEESDDPDSIYAKLGEGCEDTVDLVMAIES